MAQINTGNAELDSKIEDWFRWDKVCIKTLLDFFKHFFNTMFKSFVLSR